MSVVKIKKLNLPKAKMPKSLLGNIWHKFGRNKDGATALEFAILGLPFAALLFGIIEISVVFILTTNTEHAVSEVSREIRTGEFQSTGGSADEFKAAVCSALSGLGKCDKLRVDVVSASTGNFADLTLPESPPACTGNAAEIAACEAAQPALPADTYTSTGSGAVVIVRVQYVHQLTIPSAVTGLSNAAGNTRVITATTAFRNEPFGS
jgi:Flp pilus assembly protein TadG